MVCFSSHLSFLHDMISLGGLCRLKSGNFFPLSPLEYRDGFTILPAQLSPVFSFMSYVLVQRDSQVWVLSLPVSHTHTWACLIVRMISTQNSSITSQFSVTLKLLLFHFIKWDKNIYLSVPVPETALNTLESYYLMILKRASGKCIEN